MEKRISFLLIFTLLMSFPIRAEEVPFSKVIEIESALELGSEEIYDSEPVDVSGFRYAMILVEKSPPEKMPDPRTPGELADEEIYFGVDTFFYLDANIPRKIMMGNKHPLLTLKGFNSGGTEYGEINASQRAFKNRGVLQVEVRAPYMAVRVKQRGASKSKLRVAVFLRK